MKKQKSATQFRKYSVPEMLPFLCIFLRGSSRRKPFNTKEMLILIIIDVYQTLKGFATREDIKAVIPFVKLPPILRRLQAKGCIRNSGNTKRTRYLVDHQGSLLFRSYQESFRCEVERLMTLGIDFKRL